MTYIIACTRHRCKGPAPHRSVDISQSPSIAFLYGEISQCNRGSTGIDQTSLDNFAPYTQRSAFKSLLRSLARMMHLIG